MKSYTLREWCEMRRCSRSYFYKLLKEGKAPRTFLVGCQRRVTEQADAEWLAAREAEAQAVAA